MARTGWWSSLASYRPPSRSAVSSRTRPPPRAWRWRMCPEATRLSGGVGLAAVDDVGHGLDDQVARGGPGVLVVAGALAEVAGPALAGDHRDGGLHAGLGGGGGLVQGRAQLLALGQGGVEGLQARVPGVQHGLVLELGLAPGDHAVVAGPERRRQPLVLDLGGVAQLLAHAKEQRPVQRSRGPADLADQGHADGLEHAAEVPVALEAVEALDGRLEPAVHVGAVAAVDLTQACAWATENTGYTPQRSAGVCTGASQSRVFSSSRRRMVTEAPCISSEVISGPTRCRATCTPPSSRSWTTRR